MTIAVLFHGVEGAPNAPSDPDAWHTELPVLIGEGLAGLAIGGLILSLLSSQLTFLSYGTTARAARFFGADPHHADAASRDADPMAAGGAARTAADVFGPKGPPRGAP